MAELGKIVKKIRSKNAGPFWLTIDIFCGSPDVFAHVRENLSTNRVAKTFETEAALVKRFDIPSLSVIKFSLPRPSTQGSVKDRDMHGASWAALLQELDIN
ncbi:MAG: DUF4387 family protein [Paracoccaceae bacterium]|jgi:hypothetical protein